MGAIVSGASGNWNAGGTWVGGAIPVSGDTVTIADGHTVTVPVGYTAVVGSSPADDTGTPAIQCNGAAGTGILVVNGNLTYKGPIRQARGTWTIGQDAIITHDSSAAAVPANAHYTWLIGQTAFTATKLVVNGAAGHRVQFKIAVGSGVSGGFFGGDNADCGQYAMTFASLSDWGTPAGYCARPGLVSAGGVATFDNCLFDRCSRISATDVRDNCSYRLKNTSYRSPAAADGFAWGVDPGFGGFRVNPAAGDRRLENVFIEGGVSIFASVAGGQTGLHLVNVVNYGTAAGAALAVSGAAGVAEWNNVLILNRLAADGGALGSPSGTMTRSVLLRSGAATNPHFIGNLIRAAAWDGWVAENLEDTADNGDLFQTATGPAAFAVAIKNGVLLPRPNGLSMGSLVNHSTATPADGVAAFAPTTTVEHCTWPGDDTPGGAGGCGGENNTAFANLFAAVRANLAWRTASGAGRLCKWHDLTVPVAGTYANADYNGYWNLTGLRYFRQDTNPAEYTVAPGTHDVSADPQFVDKTRRFLTWAQSIDATVASWADAMNRFSKMNDDAGALVGFTVSACYDWIRAGWAPTNGALRTSYPGDAKQYLGAMDVAVAAPAGPSVADPTKLPTFPLGTMPDWLAYEALGVRAMAAGSTYADPVSGATVRKMSDAAYPSAANTGARAQYSSGAPPMSLPWGPAKDMRTLLLTDSNGAYLVDFNETTGARSNLRAAPFLNRELQAGFSFNPATPQILYYLKNVVAGGGNDTRHLARYDTGLNADAPSGLFPKDLTGALTDVFVNWLQFDQHDRFFVCQAQNANQVACWDSVEDRLYVGVFPVLDEPHLSADGGSLLVDYNGTSAIIRTADFVKTFDPTSHGRMGHPAGSRGGKFSQHGSGPNGDQVTVYDAVTNVDTVVPMSGRALTGAYVDAHRAAQWRQANTDPLLDWMLITSEQSSLFEAFNPVTGLSTWALVAGAKYSVAVTGMGLTGGITHVWQKNVAGTSITQKLVKVADVAAIVAPGQFCYVAGVLTVRAFGDLDLTTVPNTHKLHYYDAAGLGPYGIGFYQPGGGVVSRLACHHYSSVYTLSYTEAAFGCIASPDGKWLVFSSTQNLEGGRADVFLVRVPTTAIAGVADHLALDTQPSDCVSGVPHAVQPILDVLDATNAVVASDASTITAQLIAVTGAGVAIGVLAKVVANGVAPFAGLGVTSPAGGTFKWRFTRPGLPDLDSAVFIVASPTAPPATKPFAFALSPTTVSQPVVVMTQNDTAPFMVQQLRGADGKPQVLPSGTTVKLYLHDPTGAASIAGRDCTVLDGDNGIVRVTWQAGDFAMAGRYTGQFKSTFPAPNAGRESFPNGAYLEIIVAPEL